MATPDDFIPLRPSKPDGKNSVSLQQAVRDGREEIVRRILDSVSSKRRKKIIDAFDHHGFTALHYAARFNRFKIMQLLYNEKADSNVTTQDGLTPLHYAARYTPMSSQSDDASVTTANNKQILQLLMLWKVNLNCQDIYGVTPLHLACSRGNRAAVELLLSTKAVNVNIQDKQQDSPLHDACLYGDPWIVGKLLDEEADVLITNDEHMIPLHIACREGYVDIVRTIMGKRFELCNQMVACFDDHYNYPLHFACRSGEVEILKLILLKDVDPNVVKEGGLTGIHIAARDGFIGIAEALLQFEGLDINVRDDDLNTPLHLAAKHNRVKMIEFLLERGADIEAQDEDSYTPLLTAVAYGQREAMETLLRKKCSVDVLDRNGKSMIFIAAEENQFELLKSMIFGPVAEYCKDLLTLTDSNNNTPLHIACKKGNIESLKVLLRSNIKPDARNEADKTPMHLAATKGNVNAVRELIRHGEMIKVDLIVDEDDDSNTPLHLACINGHYNVAKVLLNASADPDVRNARQWTPMDCAANKGWDRIVELLIEFEADIDPKDKAGITPLHLACTEGHLKVVQVLLENEAKVSNTNSYQQNALDIAVENGHKDVAMAIVKSNQLFSALRNKSPHGTTETTPMRRLIKRMPDVAEEVFNRCTNSNEDEVFKEDRNYTVTFNYEFLEDFNDETGFGRQFYRALTRRRHNHEQDLRSDASVISDDTKSLDAEVIVDRGSGGFKTRWGPDGYDKNNHCLHLLANSKSVELLKHPLVTSLLNHKWHTYGQAVYFFNLFIYIIFVGFLTLFALIVFPPESETCRIIRSINESVNSTADVCAMEVSGGRRAGIAISAVIVVLFAVIKLFFEVFQLLKLRLKYFLDWINYIEISLFIGSIIFAFVFFNNCFCPTNYQWQIGAFCVFLGWIELVIVMRKFPVTGIYVVMFMNIFYIFLRMVFLAVLLILAFAFSFYMLFNDPTIDTRTPFINPWRSIVKTMTMTTGEFEFDTIFRQADNGNGADLQYATVSNILWIIFLILMPILFTNLLVGLAVDDIKGIQENAELTRLALRVELTLSVEEMLPPTIRRRFIVGERKIKPNRQLNIFEKFWYEYLGFSRFDELENVVSALHPPLEPIEEVLDQNSSLTKKVDDMQMKLDTLTEQNSQLLELLESVDTSGLTDSTRPHASMSQRVRSVSRSPGPSTVRDDY